METWLFWVLILGAALILAATVNWSGHLAGGKKTAVGAPVATLYYTPKCPHCVRLMPVWEQVEARYAVQKVDCSQQKCDGIKGYPTIVRQKDGKQFSGQRTVDEIVKFIMQ
jgi:thiol-disulfide isomerase/thioredoxin